MTTLHLKKSIDRSALRRGFSVVLLALAFAFALPQLAPAVTPAPDGGYFGGNTAEGDDALFNLTTGRQNTAIGFDALFNNSAGSFNTATGVNALLSNTHGGSNTANGAYALFSNTGGAQNTATGQQTLFNNTTGINNAANGVGALFYNTTGFNNTANGFSALLRNTTGNNNTANGVNALGGISVTFSTGNNNTANGANALFRNTTGSNNTANGSKALFQNTTGSNNTANGINAMLLNTTGNGNIAEGRGALGNNTTGSFNVAVGFNAGSNLTTGSDNIDIGALGVAGESNTMRIGTLKQAKTFISGIRGVTTVNANAVPVVIDSAGQLGTVSSSRRFKDEIKPMDNSSEAILGLKPVTFHYKTDKQNTPQFGLIAEEVAKIDPDLVVHDDNGEIYTVRYEAVNAMLLNEFLKEHQKIQSLEAKLAQQQKQIEALTATVRKVGERVERSAPAPQIAANED